MNNQRNNLFLTLFVMCAIFACAIDVSECKPAPVRSLFKDESVVASVQPHYEVNRIIGKVHVEKLYDSDDLVYKIIGGDRNEMFAVDPKTGVIRINKSFARIKPMLYDSYCTLIVEGRSSRYCGTIKVIVFVDPDQY
ncbi:hypothetical protein HCN44_003648 [Aphidius gifuensis]|uniref:Cadherin domain-containing protein n=1 Tax=Aphidius gifuensis TaxID=684658 RepID=A0A835CP63_APHGI|nr:hypothetical protein HCN44_003648 [Aphidius gifuensis]